MISTSSISRRVSLPVIIFSSLTTLSQCLPTSNIFCTSGYSYLSNKCTKLVTTTTSWSNAEKNCELDGGKLVTFSSSTENTAVFEAYQKSIPYWIGLTDEASEGNFIWLDGTTPSFFPWSASSSAPDNTGPSGSPANCVMTQESGEWNDRKCSDFYSSVCETTPVTCQSGYTLVGDRCTKLYTTTATWTNAETKCASDGGTLVSIDSKTVNTALYNAYSTSLPFWIGYTDAAVEGTWVWVDGLTSVYNAWSSNSPDNTGPNGGPANCAVMLSSPGEWNDRKCGDSNKYICQTPRVTAAPTRVPTSNPTLQPTPNPTIVPTLYPTSEPTFEPTFEPTVDPTLSPTSDPTNSHEPTVDPTTSPSLRPTYSPSVSPTSRPSASPTLSPTYFPVLPRAPTLSPTVRHNNPTKFPTTAPSSSPSTSFTPTQTETPSSVPTLAPSAAPSAIPTTAPTSTPSTSPSTIPTTAPSTQPTSAPSTLPSSEPTLEPTIAPSAPTPAPVAGSPTWGPTRRPTRSPTTCPTDSPTIRPSVAPTAKTGGSARFAASVNPPDGGSPSKPTQQPALSFHALHKKR
jgi:hypothetical protein